MTTVLFWFRRDLRLSDNNGLAWARKHADRLLGIFVADPTHSDWAHSNGDRLQFKLDTVGELRSTIRAAGGDLIVREDHPADVLPRVADREQVDQVVWNRSYEPYERERDEAVQANLEETGVQVKTFKDQVLFEREEILTNQGTPYKVFTYYADKWKSRPLPESADEVRTVESPREISPGTLPDAKSMGLERNLTDPDWTPTPEAARNRWKTFRSEDLPTYDTNRELPARDGTSKLSVYLRFGLISPRRIARDCQQLIEETTEDHRESVQTFREELIWRDFYQQVLFNFPRVVDRNFKEQYDVVEWEQHPEWLEAWKQGRTGIPIVDAAMRQLNETGWMHNRLRMIVASFLTKDCMIHWKKGEKYFMNRLLDGDTASNNGGWQWAASTGTDAAPYFRIFNPYSQSEKHDPNGEFIRTFCPELEGLNEDDIHAPHRCDPGTLEEAGVRLGETYPEPILDHSQRREVALEKFESARGE